MATVTGLTAARMLDIEAKSVVSGLVDVNGNLLLSTRGGEEIDAGHVVGPQGPQGDQGPQGPVGPMVTGLISMYPLASPPPGWLVCDGTAISRSIFAALYDVIGTFYGSGDGSTTFNLPNLKGRVPVGRDSSQTEFAVAGRVGGSKTHTLTENEIPAHTHTPAMSESGSHEHSNEMVGITPGADSVGWYGGFRHDTHWNNLQTGGTLDNYGYGWYFTGWAGAHTHGLSIANTGGGAAHNNLQPYITLNFIIKH